MYQFLMNSRNILESLIASCEEFLEKFLAPQSENIQLNEQIYDLLIKYYEDTYVDLNIQKTIYRRFTQFNDCYQQSKSNGRCQISAEIFGSTAASQYIKSSF